MSTSSKLLQRLQPNQLLRFDRTHKAPKHILCLNGVLWVTEENSGDILLREGQIHQSRNSKTLLVQALTESSVQLQS